VYPNNSLVDPWRIPDSPVELLLGESQIQIHFFSEGFVPSTLLEKQNITSTSLRNTFTEYHSIFFTEYTVSTECGRDYVEHRVH